MIRVIRHHTPVGVLPLLLSDVALLSACFYVSAELLYPPSGWFYLFYDGGVTLVAVAIATVVIAMYFFNMYAEVQVTSRIVLLQQICQALGVAIIVQTLAAYVFRDWTVPHLLMLYGSILALGALFISRIAFSALIKRVSMHGRLLFLGRSATSEAVARAIESSPNLGYRVLGFLDDVSSLRAMVEEHKPSLLVVGLSERRSVMPVADLVALRFGGLHIEEASKTFESVYHRVSLPDLSEQQMMFTRAFLPGGGALNLARVSNLLLATLCAVLLSPVWLFIALWLKLGARGPVLLRMPRAGLNGTPFSMLRFRRDNSLRRAWRFHLDALPELINVLRGEMSLVGPRPESPETAADLSESLLLYGYRTAVPPGITGWAQIHASANGDNSELALEYDLYYIKHMSLALNLYILIHSFKNRVLRG